MLKKKAMKSKTIRRPKVEHKKETRHEVHKAAEPHKELKQERYEAPKKTEVHHILKTPEPEFRGFRGILPQRL